MLPYRAVWHCLFCIFLHPSKYYYYPSASFKPFNKLNNCQLSDTRVLPTASRASNWSALKFNCWNLKLIFVVGSLILSQKSDTRNQKSDTIYNQLSIFCFRISRASLSVESARAGRGSRPGPWRTPGLIWTSPPSPATRSSPSSDWTGQSCSYLYRNNPICLHNKQDARKESRYA